MSRNRLGIVLLTVVLATAGAAWAQSDPAACKAEFDKLRGEVESRGKAIQAANERKAPIDEACRLFRNYTSAEARLVKFFVDKQGTCQIPGEVINQAKAGHAKANAMRDKVCKLAASGGAPPPPPPSQGLSGALGNPNIGAPPPETSGGTGVFDTLTGNVLRQ